MAVIFSRPQCIEPAFPLLTVWGIHSDTVGWPVAEIIEGQDDGAGQGQLIRPASIRKPYGCVWGTQGTDVGPVNLWLRGA